MNKTKKLLSVILAVIMALSCMSVMASAAKTNYKTVADLEALNAYSPYGQVTRLSTEARMSMVFDFLDNTLSPMTNLNMGYVVNVNLVITQIQLYVNLTSVDEICKTLDSAKKLLEGGLVGMLSGSLGILGDLDLSGWTSGLSRNGEQLAIIKGLVDVLGDNGDVIYNVLSTGELDLGLVGSLLGGSLDLSAVTGLIGNLPGLIKGLVYPLIERWDDNLAVIKELDKSIEGTSENYNSVEAVVNWRVKKLFSDNMSITTVKYDAEGNMTSEHNGMPFRPTAPETGTEVADDNAPRCVYVISGTTPDSTLKIYHIVDAKEAEDRAKDTDPENDAAKYTYVAQEETYVLSEEVEGNGVYVWKAEMSDDLGNTWTDTLKWYNDDSQLLPGFNSDSIDLTTMSAGDLLYTFIPTVFENLATVVLNGSLKKILAELFGAKFTHIGKAGTDEITALGSDPIFAEEQGDYVFEWSDYAIVDGKHYYRYLDDIYEADLSATNNYFDIIDFNYEITGDFMNDFIPSGDDDVNDRLLLNLNDFLIEVAKTVTVDSAETVDSISGFEATWTFPELTEGGNDNLVENLKKAAQAVISLAPQHIFGSDYETNPRCYYELLMSNDNPTVLTGIAAYIVDAVMPSMSLPSKNEIIDSGATVGAILAAVVREFAAYLTPEYNYDALIYEDFGTTEVDPVKTFVSGKDNNYWFDVILTMGINIGFEYLRAFADMGEDSAEWTAFVEYSGYKVDGGAYTEADLKLNDATANYWEGMLDYVIDWALDKDFAWTWKMETLVEVDGLTVDMTTAQNPFLKLDKILFGIIPFDEVLKIEPANGQAKFEHFLRDDLILGLINLEWAHLINTVQFPTENTANYFRSGNVLDQLASLLKRIVNSLFDKVGGGSYKLIPDAVTDFDKLANQANIATLAQKLLEALPTAYNNGLLNPVLPILGFFLGWQTNPQKYADATVWTEFRDNNDYAFQYNIDAGGNIDSAETKIKFMNNSAGMLEKHRNSSVEDHAYDITIKSITSDATVNTLTFNAGDGVCSPWETLTINVGGKYQGEEAVTVTIAYDFVGKDGEAIGGTQYTSVSFLISNQYEDANLSGRKDGDDDKDYTGTNDFKRYQFTEDIYDTVVNYQAEIHYVGTTTSNPSKNLGTIAAPDWDADCNDNRTYYDLTGNAATYFAFRAADADAGWAQTLSKDGTSQTYGYLYKAKSGVTAETEFPYGTYDMGRIAVAYGSDNKTYEIEFIHYNDYDIYDIYSENKMNGYNANQGVDSATYNEYNAAWKDIVKYATYPMMTEANGNAATDYVATIQPYIPDAIERFEAAKEAYEKALAEADANASAGAADELPGFVTDLQAEIDNDFINGKEINFQDYEYYEYFNYQDVKNAAENLYRSYLAPVVMDKYYIEGSGISQEELDKVIAAEDNEFIAAGITASRLENDQAAIDASILANEEWEMPVNTLLYVEDFTSRLAYYKTFLSEDMREDNDHLYFLEKEIAHIDAQQLNAADYEDVTWGRFAEALEVAREVAAGTDEFADFNSRIYDVKYNLMVAYKQLLAKENSLFEKGNIADLRASIETANEIFASLEAADGVWALKDGVDANTAYAELISALGYYYTGEDGNTWNLYADSALEYADNDRPNKQANQAKVDAANAALVAAMANFEKAVEDAPVLGAVEDNTGAFGEVEVDEETGFTTGYIYGVTAGDAAEDYFALVNPDAGTVVWEESAAGAVNGTGAVAVVKNTSGVEVARFTLVIFGDVDGDAGVTAQDYLAAINTTQGIAMDEVASFAANVDGDAGVTAQDYLAMINATQGIALGVNPYA